MFRNLPLIYAPSKGIEVQKETEKFLDLRGDLAAGLSEACWLYQILGKSIPQDMESMWSGHYFPYVESWEEIQIACNLTFFGLYKQAFVSLRSALELGMLSIYYNINDEGHIEVQNWLSSKNTWDSKTPRADKIWKILNSNSNVKSFNDKFGLEQKFHDLSFLHCYVHTKGYKYSNKFGRPKSNSQTFEDDIFISWLETLKKVVQIVATLHLLKYPIATVEFDWSRKFGIDIPSFGGLQENEIERFRNFLPAGHLDEIQRLAYQDSKTQNTLKEITTFPDMTELAVEDQVVRIEQMFIEHGEGFHVWKRQQLDVIQKFNVNDRTREMMMRRIEKIRIWAEENGFMDSKFDRMKREGFFKGSRPTTMNDH